MKSIYAILKFALLTFGFCWQLIGFGQQTRIFGQVSDTLTQATLKNVSVFLEEEKRLEVTNEKGEFAFSNLKAGNYTLVFFGEGYSSLTKMVRVNNGKATKLQIYLQQLQVDLTTVEVGGKKEGQYGLRKLRNVEGVAIYAAKKSEVIDLDNTLANLATNNARQVYKGVAGLNIWESDGAGLQLSIGARGLDPNRTSNFNTRQNGYDISADALGYPESYYTPPTQALKRIEIVRGAASLQYGPQFGGLLNFVFKEGTPDKAIEFVTENTVGSFGLFNTFNSIGGGGKGWRYYSFYQRKQGNGWRANSDFYQNTAYAKVSKKWNKKLKTSVEYTFMNYLAHQPGGLQDFEFGQNPRQSNRERNWFKVNWNLAAFTLDYRITDKTKLNSRSFLLSARRLSLGGLGPINRPDPLRERDLISGEYLNFGNETRLLHRYETWGQTATFLVGIRYYQGHTQNRQGDADDGYDANFEFLNPNDLERSEYEFPSRNLSIFAENLWNIKQHLSITPGFRLEYIRTASDGYYKERVFSGGQLISEKKMQDARENKTRIGIVWLGLGYKLKPDVEMYANISQNYRSINFSDLAVVNPTYWLTPCCKMKGDII